VQNSLGPEAVVATIFPDDNKKYLSTDLLRDEPAKNGFLTPNVDLMGFTAFKRVCHTCCEPFECNQARQVDSEEEDLPPCPRKA
jgi:cysteine synthase A